MSGLWDLTTITGDEFQERLNVSLLRTELTAIALDVKTKAAAQATLEASLGRPFTGNVATVGTELGDLTKLSDDFATGATQSRLVLAHKIEWALNAAELQLTDEATFRSVLGL